MGNASFLWLWHHCVCPPGQAGTQHCRWWPERGDLQRPHPAHQVPPLAVPCPIRGRLLLAPILAICAVHCGAHRAGTVPGTRYTSVSKEGGKATGVSMGEGLEGVGRGHGAHLPVRWDLIHSPAGLQAPALLSPELRDPSLRGAHRQAASPVLGKGRAAHQLRELTARVSGFSIDWLP